ncbi:MAG: hypothetical protein LBQ14_11035 [Treponema sp.]|nr:hypothetical protein [Treponema sp.]
MMDEKAELEQLRKYYEAAFPETIKALREFDSRFSCYQPKGYSLSKINDPEASLGICLPK